MAEVSFKQLLEHPSYGQQKEKLRKEINWGDPKKQYFADRKEFKKSKEEKAKLATLKAQNVKERKAHYGEDYKDYLNIPSRQIETIKF
jgi:hypothetical protein